MTRRPPPATPPTPTQEDMRKAARRDRMPRAREGVRRPRLDGARVWEAALATTEALGWAFAAPGRLWLPAMPAGLRSTPHAIAVADGRIIRTRHL